MSGRAAASAIELHMTDSDPYRRILSYQPCPSVRVSVFPAAEIGRVQVHDADEAIKIAIEQHEGAPGWDVPAIARSQYISRRLLATADEVFDLESIRRRSLRAKRAARNSYQRVGDRGSR